MKTNKQEQNELMMDIAARCGNLDVIKLLEKQGVNIHMYDDLILQYAAANGHLDIVKYCIQCGANVKAKDGLALKWAEMNAHNEIYDYILSIQDDIPIENLQEMRKLASKSLKELKNKNK